MTAQKVILKDPKKENEKYLIFLDYTLDKLRNGRPSGISLRNLASDYKSEMGTSLSYDELKEFMRLYDGVHFDKAKESIDRIIIKNKAVRILLKYSSMREYLKQQRLDTTIDAPGKKSILIRYWKLFSGLVVGILVLLGGINDWFNFRDRIFPNKNASSTIQSINSEASQDNDSINILKTDSLTKKLK